MFVTQLTPSARIPSAWANDLRDGRHADRVGAKKGEHAHLGWCFVGRSEQATVHSFGERNALFARDFPSEPDEALVVRRRHVGKAHFVRTGRSDERIAKHEIDVIANQHQVTRR
jgi:hypothetical protein